MNLGTATEQKCPQNAIFNIHEFLWSDAFYVTKDLLFSTSLSKGFFYNNGYSFNVPTNRLNAITYNVIGKQ